LLPRTQKGRDLLQTKGPYAGLTIDDEIEINLIVEKLDKLIDTIADKADIFRDSRNALPEPFQNLGQKPPDADKLAVVLDSLTIEDRSDVKEAIIDEELDLAAKFDISIVLDENGEDDDEPEVVLVEKVEPWTPSSMAGNRKKLLPLGGKVTHPPSRVGVGRTPNSQLTAYEAPPTSQLTGCDRPQLPTLF